MTETGGPAVAAGRRAGTAFRPCPASRAAESRSPVLGTSDSAEPDVPTGNEGIAGERPYSDAAPGVGCSSTHTQQPSAGTSGARGNVGSRVGEGPAPTRAARRRLRAQYNHAYKMWRLFRTRAWARAVKRINLALLRAQQ